MKKLLLITALTCGLGWTAMAQLPARMWGGGISYGPYPEKPGLHFRGFESISPQLRIGAELNIFLPYEHPMVDATDYLVDGTINLNYLFALSPKLTVYPTAGLHLKHIYSINRAVPGNEVNTVTLSMGLNAGAGLQYKVSEKGYLFAEYKRSSGTDYNNYMPTIGYMWHGKK